MKLRALALLATTTLAFAQRTPNDDVRSWWASLGGDGGVDTFGGAVMVDLDGNGDQELLASCGFSIRAFHHNGLGHLQGFPIALDSPAIAPPTVGDVDNDGDLEIFQATETNWSHGELYGFDHLGNSLPGFPIAISLPEHSPTLADLDDDGEMELLIAVRSSSTTTVHALEADGTSLPGWPVVLSQNAPRGQPQVADLDGDGQLEILIPGSKKWSILGLDGTVQLTRDYGAYLHIEGSMALGDLDGDGDLEIAYGVWGWGHHGLLVDHHDGTPVAGFPFDTYPFEPRCTPAIRDLDRDGSPEIIVGRYAANSTYYGDLFVLDAQGNLLPGFPYQTEGLSGVDGHFVITDLDADPDLEILFTSSGSLPEVIALNHDGTRVNGLNLHPFDRLERQGLSVGDLDGDGDLEVAMVVLNGWSAKRLQVVDLNRKFRPGPDDSLQFGRNPRRTGDPQPGESILLSGRARLGTTLEVTALGPAGHSVFLAASTTIDPTLTPDGWYHLGSPLAASLMFGVVLGSEGTHTVELELDGPGLGVFSGQRLFFQGIVFGPSHGHITELESLLLR